MASVKKLQKSEKDRTSKQSKSIGSKGTQEELKEEVESLKRSQISQEENPFRTTEKSLGSRNSAAAASLQNPNESKVSKSSLEKSQGSKRSATSATSRNPVEGNFSKSSLEKSLGSKHSVTSAASKKTGEGKVSKSSLVSKHSEHSAVRTGSQKPSEGTFSKSSVEKRASVDSQVKTLEGIQEEGEIRDTDTFTLEKVEFGGTDGEETDRKVTEEGAQEVVGEKDRDSVEEKKDDTTGEEDSNSAGVGEPKIDEEENITVAGDKKHEEEEGKIVEGNKLDATGEEDLTADMDKKIDSTEEGEDRMTAEEERLSKSLAMISFGERTMPSEKSEIKSEKLKIPDQISFSARSPGTSTYYTSDTQRGRLPEEIRRLYGMRPRTSFVSMMPNAGTKDRKYKGSELQTYQLAPARLFTSDLVEPVLERYAAEAVRRMPSYRTDISEVVALHLSTKIRDELSRMFPKRYKINVLVTVGEKKYQGYHTSCRCLWAREYDSLAVVTEETATYFIQIITFGIYKD